MKELKTEFINEQYLKLYEINDEAHIVMKKVPYDVI